MIFSKAALSSSSGLSRLRSSLPRLVVLSLLLFVLLIPNAYAKQTRDLIVVIDVSTSMIGHFDLAKTEAKQFISSAQLGDRVTIITFGESSNLLERRRIRSTHDVAKALSVIDGLEATEYSSNLPSGMERGLEEMRRFYEENPDVQRVFMWLSDDKNNPPEDLTDAITFATIKERQTSRLPDHNWFVFDAPIETEEEADFSWFVDWASRTKMSLNVITITNESADFYVPETRAKVTVRFEPDTQAVWGTSFSVVAKVDKIGGGPPVSEVIPVKPNRVICSEFAWEETFVVNLPYEPGNYRCTISFVLPSDKMLEITPPEAVLKARIIPVEKKVKPEAIAKIKPPTSQAEKKRRFDEAKFVAEVKAELMEGARESVKSRGLVFGPVTSGSEFTISRPITPSRSIPLESIYIRTNLDLPEGLDLKPEFEMDDGKVVAKLILMADDSFGMEQDWEMLGGITFHSTVDGVKINPVRMQTRIYGKESIARQGKGKLVQASTIEGLSNVGQIVKAYAPKIVLLLVVLAPVVYFLKKLKSSSTRLSGTLEIMQCPDDTKKDIFDLRRMGRFRTINVLTVGKSDKADIVLPHASVGSPHARITTAMTESGQVVYVQPLNGNQIMVNGIPYDQRKEIGDMDVLTIGEFDLQYKAVGASRETIVEFADGNRVRGSLVSWDIAAQGFQFLPKGAPSIVEKMVVQFSEIKSVSFIRSQSRFSRPSFLQRDKKPDGRLVDIFFLDGEMVEGYMVGDSNEWSERFYLVPKENDEISMMLIERSAVRDILSEHAFGEMAY